MCKALKVEQPVELWMGNNVRSRGGTLENASAYETYEAAVVVVKCWGKIFKQGLFAQLPAYFSHFPFTHTLKIQNQESRIQKNPELRSETKIMLTITICDDDDDKDDDGEECNFIHRLA